MAYLLVRRAGIHAALRSAASCACVPCCCRLWDARSQWGAHQRASERGAAVGPTP